MVSSTRSRQRSHAEVQQECNRRYEHNFEEDNVGTLHCRSGDLDGLTDLLLEAFKHITAHAWKLIQTDLFNCNVVRNRSVQVVQLTPGGVFTVCLAEFGQNAACLWQLVKGPS